jgi:hypothetical protein
MDPNLYYDEMLLDWKSLNMFVSLHGDTYVDIFEYAYDAEKCQIKIMSESTTKLF